MHYLADFFQVGRYKSGGTIGAGSNQLIINEKREWEEIIKIFSFLKHPFHKKNLKLHIKNKYPSVDPATLNKVVDIVEKNNLLIPLGNIDFSDKYSRNHLYYHFFGADSGLVQKKLSGSHVVILGCGGIGNHVSHMLSTSGVGKITLVDNDVIESSNIIRQVLFTENDVGFKKAEVIEKNIKDRTKDVAVNILDLEIKGKDDLDLLPPSDLLVVSADKPFSLIKWVNEYCVSTGTPYINIGYINDISVIGPFYIPGQTGCIACQEVMPKYGGEDNLRKEIDEINDVFRPASFPSVNGVSASYAVGDIIKYLGGFGEVLSINKRVGIHSSSLKIEIQDLTRNTECLVCGKKQKE